MAEERARHLESHPSPAHRSAWRTLLECVLASLRHIRGPQYWAARVARLERGAASQIEARVRTASGVVIAHVTPSIDGSATISVSYDARRISAESLSALIEPLAPGLELIDTPAMRSTHPEDQCVC